MIKTILISFIALSGIGTSAMAVDTLKPASIELTAGTLMFSLKQDGISTQVIEKPDYAIRLKTQKDRVIAIRF